jgi:hypothetical protein
MTWTKDKPTVPGWYWYRNPHGFVWVENIDEKDGELCAVSTAGVMYLVENYPGEWAGPLPLPEEPSHRQGVEG